MSNRGYKQSRAASVHCSTLKMTGLKLWRELRPTVSRPVRLGFGLPFGAHDQIMSLFFFSFDNYFVVLPRAPSLTGGRVCS
jgi:hypothetical protein